MGNRLILHVVKAVVAKSARKNVNTSIMSAQAPMTRYSIDFLFCQVPHSLTTYHALLPRSRARNVLLTLAALRRAKFSSQISCFVDTSSKLGHNSGSRVCEYYTKCRHLQNKSQSVISAMKWIINVHTAFFSQSLTLRQRSFLGNPTFQDSVFMMCRCLFDLSRTRTLNIRRTAPGPYLSSSSDNTQYKSPAFSDLAFISSSSHFQIITTDLHLIQWACL